MPTSTIDALIVGAGPVGLTAAVALTHQGLTCRIIEKTPSPSDKSKALVVWCRTLELLDSCGLAAVFVASGLKINGGSMYANGQRLVHLTLTSDDSRYGFPLMIPQNETERLLTEHLARQGVKVERQVELASFEERADSVVCKLRPGDGGEESCETPWLVGCDGAHSTVRHGLGMPFTGQPEPNDWMLADVHIEGPLAADEVSIYWHEKGILAFFPINRDRFRMIADIGAASGGTQPADPTLADAQAKADERGPGGLTMSNPVWLANFRINERKVRDYRRGRVLLAGDAAHIHSPAGGQGMNTGMQDAFNLAWKLALVQRGEGQTEPLLESYSSERSAVGDQVLHNAERFTAMATLRNPAARWLRDHLAPILGSFQFVRDKIRDDWFELSINYRHSPLSAEKWPPLKGGLAAGDRLCDAPLKSSADSSLTTLSALHRGVRHTLLLLPGASDPAAIAPLLHIAEQAALAFPDVFSAQVILKAEHETATAETATLSKSTWIDVEMGTLSKSTWIDVDGRVHQKLGVTDSALFVIRPDGYIGFRCQPADATAIRNYLDRYLLRKS